MSPIRATTRVAHNEYTHWLTDVHADPLATNAEAEMAGVVDGDVGPGRFAGQLIREKSMTDVMQGVRILEVAEHMFVPAASAILSRSIENARKVE